ncbi:MAG: hypothetical protein EOM03_10805 [Clostridia bacterium]|nr:hypothetical protein [Clostridia bacterium]
MKDFFVPKDSLLFSNSMGMNSDFSVRGFSGGISEASATLTVTVNAAGSQPWTPADITTALWLDAADSATITESGGAVSQWADKSGYGRNAAQTVGSYKPALASGAVNALNAILFDGLNDYLGITGNLPVASEMAEFVVFRRETAGILTMPLGGNNKGAPPYGILGYTDNVAYSGLRSSGYLTHGSISTGTYISALARDASVAELFINGTSLGGAKTAGAVSGTLDIVSVGARATSYHNGLIAEIIVLHSNPSVEDRQKIEGYLAHKWGLAANLPSDHPYKSAPPTI